MKKLKLLGATLALGATLIGCVTLDPGADPLVVRAEQTLDLATNTFQTVVHVDDLNRAFWKSNAPAFHMLAESLRQPVWTPLMSEPQPWGVSLIVDAWSAKQAYKTNRTAFASNQLYVAWSVLNETVTRSANQLSIINATNFVWPH